MKLSHFYSRFIVENESVSPNDIHRQALDDTGFWGKAGAGCIFIARSTGRILIACRSDEVQEPNTYGTWGGAIDPNEKPEDAVRREAHEETGGQAGHLELMPLYTFKNKKFRYYNFLAIVDEEFTPVLDWENAGFVWCDFGKWPSPMHFGLKNLLNDPESRSVISRFSRDFKNTPKQR